MTERGIVWRVGVWALLGVGLWWLAGPPPLACLRPGAEQVVDYFHDWVSARLYLDGDSPYTDHQGAYERYFGADGRTVRNRVHTHTPPSILMGLPLGLLPYPDAMLVLNLGSVVALAASLWLIVRTLKLSVAPWAWLPIAVLTAWCFPLWDHLCSGQINLYLLLLILLAWVAQRNDRQVWAGVCVGLATAFKLFPGYLFLYFLARRQWRALAAGVLTGVVCLGLCVAAFGVELHRDYLTRVVPQGASQRTLFPNTSLTAWWSKAFAGTGEPGHTEPLLARPWIAKAGNAGSWLVVTGLVGWLGWRGRREVECDHVFGLALVGMLLLSPVTWPHYFVVLLLPLVLLWRDLPDRGPARGLFWLAVAFLWLNPYLYWTPLLGLRTDNWYRTTVQPLPAVTLISLQTYALVGVFALVVWLVGVGRSNPAPVQAGRGIAGRRGRGALAK